MRSTPSENQKRILSLLIWVFVYYHGGEKRTSEMKRKIKIVWRGRGCGLEMVGASYVGGMDWC